MNPSMTVQNPTNVTSLFNTAGTDGSIDPTAIAVVNIPNLTANIQAALGVSVDDVEESNVVLLTLMLDDSSSIEGGNNTDNVINGANLVLDAVGASKEGGILVHITTLNHGHICPFTPLSNAPRVSRKNYSPNGLTPLYDKIAEVAGSVLAKTEEFNKVGVPVRTVTLIVTDGANVGSRQYTEPEQVAPVIKAMRAAEQHIVAAMGIDDGSTPFRDIFTRASIDQKWILTPKNNPSEIRAAFVMASKSAARASVAAPGAFSATSAGGFASP